MKLSETFIMELTEGPWAGQAVEWPPSLRWELPLRGYYQLEKGPTGFTASWHPEPIQSDIREKGSG